MVEINGKSYELKYSLQRVELIENATGTSIMAMFQKNNGLMSINELKIYFGYGLKEEGSDIFVNPKKAIDIAEELIEKEGYTEVVTNIMNALQRDCPFFFQAP